MQNTSTPNENRKIDHEALPVTCSTAFVGVEKQRISPALAFVKVKERSRKVRRIGADVQMLQDDYGALARPKTELSPDNPFLSFGALFDPSFKNQNTLED